MKKIILIFTIFLPVYIYSQDKVPIVKEPILFFEFILGGAREFKPKTGGFLTGLTIKSEVNKNLYAIRYLKHFQSKHDFTMLTFVPIPYVKEKIIHRELGLLYGRRWSYYDTSFSISGGISYNNHTNEKYLKNDETIKESNNSIGLPLEINLKVFKGRKKPFRAVYGLIPIGKPTAFGRSVGLKLAVNISKYNFIGFGVTYGFGNHKSYM